MQSRLMYRMLRIAILAAFALLATLAFAGTTIYNIDQKTGWESCSTCAGAGGNGPTATHTMTLNVATPSRDGHAAKFTLGGTTPYSNALWWKQLGANSAIHNFKYDLYYYIKTPTAAQALEFDVNQSVGGKKYIFGTECDFKGTKTWHVYDPYNRAWKSTSIYCAVPKAYTWHHVVLEFDRNSSGQTGFLAVTIDGAKHYFNRVYAPHSASASEINVAFQMDGNKSQTDYSVWVDSMKLTIW